ncbi:MAG: hypothetical protein LBB18_01095 [Puniceicoccales bacterium]|jgi:hypothetical protein|nr:hypothetical protein [Puniceicoccales bacterium]
MLCEKISADSALTAGVSVMRVISNNSNFNCEKIGIGKNATPADGIVADVSNVGKMFLETKVSSLRCRICSFFLPQKKYIALVLRKEPKFKELVENLQKKIDGIGVQLRATSNGHVFGHSPIITGNGGQNITTGPTSVGTASVRIPDCTKIPTHDMHSSARRRKFNGTRMATDENGNPLPTSSDEWLADKFAKKAADPGTSPNEATLLREKASELYRKCCTSQSSQLERNRITGKLKLNNAEQFIGKNCLLKELSTDGELLIGDEIARGGSGSVSKASIKGRFSTENVAIKLDLKSKYTEVKRDTETGAADIGQIGTQDYESHVVEDFRRRSSQSLRNGDCPGLHQGADLLCFPKGKVDINGETATVQPLIDGHDCIDGISGRKLNLYENGFPKDPLLATRLAVQLAMGVVSLHKNGYTHCDLKPENILITNENTPILKIIDAGTMSTNGTKHRGGTVYYIAPETLTSIGNGQIPARTPAEDVYDIGLLLPMIFFNMDDLSFSLNGTHHVDQNLSERRRLVFRRMKTAERLGYVSNEFIAANSEARTNAGVSYPNNFIPVVANLITDMTNPDPTKRPKAVDVLEVLQILSLPELGEGAPSSNLQKWPISSDMVNNSGDYAKSLFAMVDRACNPAGQPRGDCQTVHNAGCHIAWPIPHAV